MVQPRTRRYDIIVSSLLMTATRLNLTPTLVAPRPSAVKSKVVKAEGTLYTLGETSNHPQIQEALQATCLYGGWYWYASSVFSSCTDTVV